MGEDAGADLPRLVVAASGTEARTEVPLEHAEDRLDLPPLAIRFLGEVLLHQPPIVSPRRSRLAIFSGSAAFGCRDNTSNAEIVPADAVERFRFVARVGNQRVEPLLIQGSQKRLLTFGVVELGTAVDHDPEDQMVGRVADGRELGIAVFLVPSVPPAPPRVVSRHVARLQAGGVNGRQWADRSNQALLACEMNRCIKDSPSAPFFSSRRSA